MSKKPNLTPDRIILGAIDLLNREGSKGFSMRKLASQFGVDPMALYYHIPNRSALLSRVIDRVMCECNLPVQFTPWQDSVKQTCIAFRQMSRKHPGVIQVWDGFDDWTSGEHRVSEALHTAFRHAGFTDEITVKGARLLLNYVNEFCINEITHWIEPYTPDMCSKLSDSLALGDFPVTTSLVDVYTDVDPDREFSFGLNVIIKGLESNILAYVD